MKFSANSNSGREYTIKEFNATEKLFADWGYINIVEYILLKQHLDAGIKEDGINDIKKKLPLTEAEFDSIKENTFLYYLSILDDKYRFTKLEKLYLMEYVLLRGEPNGKNDD